MTSTEIQAEISEKEQLLGQTDHEVVKAVESFLTAASTASGILGLVKAVKDAIEDITDLLANRAQWRARIGELEALTPDDESGEVA